MKELHKPRPVPKLKRHQTKLLGFLKDQTQTIIIKTFYFWNLGNPWSFSKNPQEAKLTRIDTLVHSSYITKHRKKITPFLECKKKKKEKKDNPEYVIDYDAITELLWTSNFLLAACF